jgi:hypothetical protein
MARLVAGAGRIIQRASVIAITYSVHELEPCRQRCRGVVAGHDGVALDIGAVLFDALQKCRFWTVDDLGYNFRHEFDVHAHDGRAGEHYQIRYELTPTIGPKTIIAFQLKVN